MVHHTASMYEVLYASDVSEEPSVMSERGIATAALILFISLTPTWGDVALLWDDKPEYRTPVVLWYAALLYLAYAYWRVLS